MFCMCDAMLELAAEWFCLSSNQNPKMPLLMGNRDNWAILQLLIFSQNKVHYTWAVCAIATWKDV